MSDSMGFVRLFENGDFVSFGKEFKKKGVNRYEVSNEIYSAFDPQKKSENFFELDEWERNRLAFAVAVKSVAKGLTTSQIRKILNMSAKIYRNLRKKEDISKDVVKLNYTLAYTLGRQGRRGEIEPVAEVLSKVLPELRTEKENYGKVKENYEKVHDFLQAVVAYHKLLGGRD